MTALLPELRPRRGPWRVRLALVALMGFLGLVAGELLVRWRVGVPLAERLPLMAVRSNPLRGYEMVPGLHYTYQHPVHVNALGLRGAELEPRIAGVAGVAGAADEMRVLALGDSLIYGQGVGDDETLPFYLERELESLDPLSRPWTVVNGGARGYDTRQELALAEELCARIEPDVVVLYWFWNDFLEHPTIRAYARLEDLGPVVFDTGDRLEGRSLLEWRVRQLVRQSALAMFLYDNVSAALAEPFEPEFVERSLTRLDHYLERFQALSRRHGFRPVVAIVPERSRLRGPDFTAELEARVAELARRHDLPVIELYEPLRALTAGQGKLPVIPYDGHYVPSANRAMAQATARELMQLVQVGG